MSYTYVNWLLSAVDITCKILPGQVTCQMKSLSAAAILRPTCRRRIPCLLDILKISPEACCLKSSQCYLFMATSRAVTVETMHSQITNDEQPQPTDRQPRYLLHNTRRLQPDQTTSSVTTLQCLSALCTGCCWLLKFDSNAWYLHPMLRMAQAHSTCKTWSNHTYQHVRCAPLEPDDLTKRAHHPLNKIQTVCCPGSTMVEHHNPKKSRHCAVLLSTDMLKLYLSFFLFTLYVFFQFPVFIFMLFVCCGRAVVGIWLGLGTKTAGSCEEKLTFCQFPNVLLKTPGFVSKNIVCSAVSSSPLPPLISLAHIHVPVIRL